MAAFIVSQREAHGVPCAVGCRALGVSLSWFYKWRPGVLPPSARRRARLDAEIATGEGKLYLDSVLDMGSRRILGHALGERRDAALSVAALLMAAAVRGGNVRGAVMHTDQGSEYTAQEFRDACVRLGIVQSMGRPGSALDNAVIESWHSTLEWELRSRQEFETKARARAGVAAFIEDYNHVRRHSALGMKPPVAWEREQAAARDAGGAGEGQA